MIEKDFSPIEKEQLFFKKIIRDYLTYGSVDEVFKAHNYDLPISYPGVHRLLDKWGIVKAAGPNTKLSETLVFLHILSEEQIPLERFYKKIPPSFQTSLSTMHRILHNIKNGTIRRNGTALVITPEASPNEILVGDDISTPRLGLGKPYGSISLPMGFSKSNERPTDSILRILQQEVLTENAINENMPHVISDNPEPFMYLDIADVRVAVYNLELPMQILSSIAFTSYKLINHRFMNKMDIINNREHSLIRAGLKEISLGFEKYQNSNVTEPLFETSLLNYRLAIAFAY